MIDRWVLKLKALNREMNLESRHEPIAGYAGVPLRMTRDHLDNIPVFEPQEGYAIRWYAPGDAAHWLRIHEESEGYGDLKPDLFADQYGSDEDVLSRRVAFICKADGVPVSTNTAWMNDWNGKQWGRIHWVATTRNEQGKGHSKPLMTSVCVRMKELGHDCAYLTTNALRVRAIALYAAFGFTAYWESEKEQVAWEELIERMADLGKRVEVFRG